MIGKVIAYGDTREQAIRRMRIALSEMMVDGIKTNIPLHQDLMLDPRFIKGGTSIHYLEEKLAARSEATEGQIAGNVGQRRPGNRRRACGCAIGRADGGRRDLGQRRGRAGRHRPGNAPVRRAGWHRRHASHALVE
jgi:hypothetical protein